MEKDKFSKAKIRALLGNLWAKKWLFCSVWGITFVLSCVWILPQPRYYTCSVSVSPESSDDNLGGNISSLAASFGLNMGALSGQDAIYPQLYPELFSSTEFLAELMDIPVKTIDGELETDYFDYIAHHQKENMLLWPINRARAAIHEWLSPNTPVPASTDGKRFDPFRLDRNTTEVFKNVKGKIRCKYSKTTDVVTITVEDQDPLICATMADSVRMHLQTFISAYRTNKARQDYQQYKAMTEDAEQEYEKVKNEYVAYADAHNFDNMMSSKTKMKNLENNMDMQYSIYKAMRSRMDASLFKMQDQTPVFTVLTPATVPVKPARPKRMVFVAAMLLLATIGTVVYLFRDELAEWF